jgi:hypothetical protein
MKEKYQVDWCVCKPAIPILNYIANYLVNT